MRTPTAFLTPALRNINRALTADLELVGSPREVYRYALELLDDVYAERVSSEDLLTEVLRVLVLIREEKRARMSGLLAVLRQEEDALPLSTEETVKLVGQHLACKNASRLPVLVVASAYRAATERLSENVLPLRSHNAADQQTGALGDVEITLVGDDKVVTCYEIKAKKVREYATSLYSRSGGIEFGVLDCLEFLLFTPFSSPENELLEHVSRYGSFRARQRC